MHISHKPSCKKDYSEQELQALNDSAKEREHNMRKHRIFMDNSCLADEETGEYEWLNDAKKTV